MSMNIGQKSPKNTSYNHFVMNKIISIKKSNTRTHFQKFH